MKENIKNFKKSKIFVSLCLMILVAIFASCLFGASVAFANDGANTEETPVIQDFTKVTESRYPYKIGDNLKGKSAVLDYNLVSILNSTDFRIFEDQWIKEEGRKEGDLFKLVEFEDNDVDYVAMIAVMRNGNLRTNICASGVFEVFNDEDGNVHDTVPEGDVVLTPKYEIKTLKVTFDTDEPFIEEIEYGKTVAKPEDPVAPEGYEFGGWYKDYKHQNAFDFDEPITDDVTIYPEFIKVKIVENGGSNAELKAFGQKCNEWFAKNWKIFTPCAVAGVAIIIFAIVLGVKAKRYR